MSALKPVGLIGGMSWQSTLPYYQLINQGIHQRAGGLHSAPCLLWSVDFAPIAALQADGRWDEAGRQLAGISRTLEGAGAKAIALCTNTMHKIAPAIEAAINIPFLHIVDPLGQAIRARNIKRVGLLATRFTMEEEFYRQLLAERFGLDVLIPEPKERDRIHHIIFDELCLGKILPSSRQEYLRIAEGLIAAGAQGIILGCTEIGLLLKDGDAAVPFFDTTALHAQAIVDFMCE